ASAPQARIDLVWLVISAAACLVVFGLIVFASRRTPDSRAEGPQATAQDDDKGRSLSGERFSLAIALLICLMLLVGPLTSKIYFIALLWPVASLAAFAFREMTRAARRVRVLLIAVAIVNSVLPLLPGRSLQRGLLVLGVDFYINLLLLLAVAY